MLRAVSHVGYFEEALPGHLAIDGQVPGVAQRVRVIVIRCGSNGAGRLRIASGRLLQADLWECDRLPAGRIIGLHVLRDRQRTRRGLIVPCVLAPPAPNHSIAISLDIIGESETRTGVCEASRHTAIWNARVDAMPAHARILDHHLAGTLVLRYVLREELRQPYGHAHTLTVIPAADVVPAHAEIEGKPPVGLPRIH